MRVYAAALSIAFVALLGACSSGTQPNPSASGGPTGQLRVSLNGDTNLATIAIQNVFDPTQTFLVDCRQKPHLLDGGVFCDELTVLPPGVYELIVQSQDPNCHSEFNHYKVVVQENQTVEVTVNLVCGGANGGLDVIVLQQNRPVITGINFTNSDTQGPGNKFICEACGALNPDIRVEVQTTHPNTSCAQMFSTVQWTAVDSQGNDATGTLFANNQLQTTDGTCGFSILIDSAAPIGNYQVTFSVSDGTLPPATITFPIHIIDCGCGPAIQVIKLTNGEDANTPPGPMIPVGAPVTWTYLVSNTGNENLTGITLTDDHLGNIIAQCPGTSLAPGQDMVCNITGTAQAGQYANLATVTGNPPSGPPVTDTDPSHYLGITPAIDIEKFVDDVNGFPQDADTPPGPTLPVGSTVHWLYEVTNTGNVPLTNVTVTDDKGAAVTCTQTTLAPGATMICNAFGSALPGLNTNIGTATGTPPAGPNVTDSDPANYTGAGTGPAVRIVKSTNGQDANSPPGPTIPVGGTVNWTYVVTNVGTEALNTVVVTDSQGVVVSCPATTLAVGVSFTCTATGTAQAGQYANVGTVTAIGSPSGIHVSDTDPSHYFGQPPSFCLDAAANFVVFGMDGGTVSVNSASTVIGDFGYGAGVTSTVNQKIGDVQPWDGGAYVHSGDTFAFSAKDYLPSDGIHIGTDDARLDAANAAMLNVVAGWTAYAANPLNVDAAWGVLGDNDSRVFNSAVGDTTNLITITSLSYNQDTITLNGNPGEDDKFIIVVYGNFFFDGSQIILGPGVGPEDVLWVFPNASTIEVTKDTSVFQGTLIAPLSSILYHNPATWNGALYGHALDLHSEFSITYFPNEIPCPPSP